MNIISKTMNVKGSILKINMVSKLIKGETVENALIQLNFCKKKISQIILCALKSAIANAKNNYNITIEKLYVKKIIIGKYKSLKRSRVRAKGKIDKIEKKFSNLIIVITEI